jgi:hypothetical protein
VHEPWAIGAVLLFAEDAEAGPGGGERGEDLRSRERETPLDGFDLRQRIPQHEIVARLAVAEREQLAGLGIPQHPLETRVSAVVQHAGDADPDEVHVDAEGGRGRMRREQPLVARGVEQAAWCEVTGGAQLVEVLGEEPVVAVVPGGAITDASQQVGRQHGHPSRVGVNPPHCRGRRVSEKPSGRPP